MKAIYFAVYLFFPVGSAFLARGYWESYPETALLLWMSPVLYLAACIAAGLIARRLQFDKYELSWASSGWSAFFGCLFYGVVYFPSFLKNAQLILTRRAHPGKPHDKPNLCDLGLIIAWNALWAVLIPMAIPSLFLSPMRMNEQAAINALHLYHGAQVQFRETAARAAGSSLSDAAYCNNFRNLHYDQSRNGVQLGLIPREMADAFAGPTSGAPTMGDHAKIPAAFRGYLFLEDPYIAENNLWNEQFGIIAYPKSHRTGSNFYWVGTDDRIYMRYYDRDKHELMPVEESPLSAEGKLLWDEL